MYNIQERLEKFKLTFDEDPEIDYLKKTEIVDVVNRALADLYLSQPDKPINYLANWLYSESHGNEMKLLIEKENKKKQERIDEHNNMINEKNKIKASKEEEENLKLKEKLDFIDAIKKYENFDSNLNVICDKLCYFTNSTGAYFSKYDNKRKKVKITDDENAHLMPNKVLRYIGFSYDHDFLIGKNLEINTGVTYDFFDSKKKINTIKLQRFPEEVEKDGKIVRCKESANSRTSKKSRLKRLKESAKDQPFILNYIIIDEVVYEKRMHYFREPRLGCYLALEIVINSSLSTASLNSAVTKFTTYTTKKKEYEDRLAEIQRKKEEEEEEERQRQLEIENKSEENERKETTTQKSQKEEKDKKENKNNNSAVKTSKENKNNKSALNNSKENKEKEKSRELEKSTNEIKKDRIESPKGNKENSNNNISKDVNATNENNKTEGGNLEANLEAEENIPLVQEDILDQTVILEEYETFPKKYYLSLDTLGQDRVFNEEELKYIFDVVKAIKYSWEDLEDSLLIKDRDIRISQIETETILKTKEVIEEFETKEEDFIRDFFEKEENAAKLEEPGFKASNTELLKVRFIIKIIQDDERLLKIFNYISEYEVKK